MRSLCHVGSALTLALVITGCPPPVGPSVSGEVSGIVHKGLVAGADVVAFQVAGRGRGSEVGSASSDDAGTFKIDLGTHQGDLIVCATGGEFVDEATGSIATLGANDVCSYIADFQLNAKVGGVVVGPVSSVHTAYALCLSDPALASERVNAYFGIAAEGYDFASTVPFDVVTGVAPSLTAEVWAGLLHAGLSQTARRNAEFTGVEPGLTLTGATLTSLLVQDISRDCVLDGADDDEVLFHGDVRINSDTLRGDSQGLLAGLLEFLDYGRNASGLTSDDVRSSIDIMAAYESPLFGPLFAPPDLDPPEIRFDAPTSPTLSGEVIVSVAVNDASEIVTCEVTSPTALASLVPDFTADSTECALTGDLNTSLLGEGPLAITVYAEDSSGNRREATYDAIVDNELPVVSVATPSFGSVISGVVTVEVSATDSAGIASLTVLQPSALVDTEPAAGTFSAQWDTTAEFEGDFTFVVEAVDGNGVVANIEVPVNIDNIEATTISGQASMGLPVVATRISAYEWPDGERGDLLGDAQLTDQSGDFQIVTTSPYSGPVLLVASGGGYTDLATGGFYPLAYELAVATSVVAGDDVLQNMNPLAALATAHATSTVATNEGAVDESYDALGLHLSRPTGITLAAQDTVDVTENSFPATDSGALLTMTLGGLSRLAADFSVALTGQTGAVSTDALLNALAADARDGVFDGKEGQVQVFLSPGRVADAYSLRQLLTIGVHNFATDKPLPGVTHPRNASGILSETLQAPGGLIPALALNDDARLFPASSPPLPFDDEPPTVLFALGGVHSAQGYAEQLIGAVTLQVSATDADSPIDVVEIVAPSAFVDENPDPAVVSLSFGTAIQPNLTAVAQSCGFSLAESPLLETPEKDRQVCLCADASDLVGNSTRDIFCFTRPLPSVAFFGGTPDDGTVATGAFPISVVATTGFDLATLGIEPAGLADTNPDPAIFESIIPAAFVAADAPNIMLVATATDSLGAEATVTRTISRPPLELDLLAPLDGDQLVSTSFPYAFQAAASSGYPVATCAWSVMSEAGAEVESGTGSVAGNSCVVSGSFGTAAFADGAYTFTVSVDDDAGSLITKSAAFTKTTTQGVATFTSPLANEHTNAASVDLIAQLDGDSITDVKFYLNRPGGDTLTLSPSVGATTATLTTTGNQLQDEGTYTYYAEVTSMTGGTQFTSNRVFIVDRTPPTVTSNQNSYTLKNEEPNGNYAVSGTIASGNVTLVPTVNRTYPLMPTPTIYKWSTRLNQSSPTVNITVNDVNAGDGAFTDPSDLVVRWDFAATCTSHASMTSIAPGGPSRNVTLSEDATTADLESAVDETPLCFAAYAEDKAGNVSAQYTRTINWSTVAPPVAFDASGDASLYDPELFRLDFEHYADASGDIIWGDISSAFSSGQLCPTTNPWCESNDMPREHYAIAHAVMFNPWNKPVRVGFDVNGKSRVVYTPTHYAFRGWGQPRNDFWGDFDARLRNPFSSTSVQNGFMGEPRYSEHCEGPGGSPQAGVIGMELFNSNYQPGGPVQQADCHSTQYPGVGYLLDGRSPQTPPFDAPFTEIIQIDYEQVLGDSEANSHAKVAYFELEGDGTVKTVLGGKPVRIPRDADGLIELEPGVLVVALVFANHTPSSAEHGETLSTIELEADCMLFGTMTELTVPRIYQEIDYSRVLKDNPITAAIDDSCRTFLIPMTNNDEEFGGAIWCGDNSTGTTVNCEFDRLWWQADQLRVHWGDTVLSPPGAPTFTLETATGNVAAWHSTAQTGGGERRHE